MIPQNQNRVLLYLIHGFCFLLALTELTLLAVFSSLRGGAEAIVGFSVFGTSLVLFYLFRGLYCLHHQCERRGPILQKMDHAMMFILIAATYTPIALLLPSPGWAWSIFGVAWGIALMGILMRLLNWVPVKWELLFLYLAFLALDITAFSTVHDFLNPSAVFFLSLGGIFYMIATGFIALRPSFKWIPFFGTHETVAILFVSAASFTHFWALLKYVLPV